MPLTYAGNGNYRIECNGPSCTNHVVVAGRWQRENADAADVTTGLPVSD